MKIINAKILTDDFTFLDGSLEFDREIITKISADPQMDADPHDNAEGNVLDAEGCYLIPGLIDVHMHGYYGVDCGSEDPKMQRKIGQGLVKSGVTAYASTIGSTYDDKAFKGLDAIREMTEIEEKDRTGARSLGVHMEGPFLNVMKKGGMEEKAIVPPSIETFNEYQKHAGGRVKIMTIAPEMDGAEEVIRWGTSQGVRMSAGHTNATKAEFDKAKEWGIVRATHTFNAMRPLNHREPGVLGAVLMDDDIQCEMITDFVHLNPEICLMIVKLKGPDKVTLISDSLSLAGLTQEEMPKDLDVIVADALYLPSGTLCGSLGTVMTGVRNLVKSGISLEDAVKMGSINPAKEMGVSDKLGSLKEGKYADMVLIDQELNVKGVWIGGKKLV